MVGRTAPKILPFKWLNANLRPTRDRSGLCLSDAPALDVGEMIGAVGLRKSGGLVAALEHGFATIDPDTAAISNRRVAVRIPEAKGAPDGLTIDTDGMLWVAYWGGPDVGRWDPATGERLVTVDVPATQVSSCAFGGENRDQLFITTARKGLSDDALAEQSLAGGLFRVEPDVRGGSVCVFDG